MKNAWVFVEKTIRFTEEWIVESANGIEKLYNGPLLLLFSEETIVEIMPYLVMMYLFLADLVALG